MPLFIFVLSLSTQQCDWNPKTGSVSHGSQMIKYLKCSDTLVIFMYLLFIIPCSSSGRIFSPGGVSDAGPEESSIPGRRAAWRWRGRPCRAPYLPVQSLFTQVWLLCAVPADTRGCRSHSDMALPSTFPQQLPDFTPHPPSQQVLPPTLRLCAAGQGTIDTPVTQSRLGFPPRTGSSRASAGHTRGRERLAALPPGRGSGVLAPDSAFPELRYNGDACQACLPRAARREEPGSPAHLLYRGTQCP